MRMDIVEPVDRRRQCRRAVRDAQPGHARFRLSEEPAAGGEGRGCERSISPPRNNRIARAARVSIIDTRLSRWTTSSCTAGRNRRSRERCFCGNGAARGRTRVRREGALPTFALAPRPLGSLDGAAGRFGLPHSPRHTAGRHGRKRAPPTLRGNRALAAPVRDVRRSEVRTDRSASREETAADVLHVSLHSTGAVARDERIRLRGVSRGLPDDSTSTSCNRVPALFECLRDGRWRAAAPCKPGNRVVVGSPSLARWIPTIENRPTREMLGSTFLAWISRCEGQRFLQHRHLRR
jgi:hypothetical protein